MWTYQEVSQVEKGNALYPPCGYFGHEITSETFGKREDAVTETTKIWHSEIRTQGGYAYLKENMSPPIDTKNPSRKRFGCVEKRDLKTDDLVESWPVVLRQGTVHPDLPNHHHLLLSEWIRRKDHAGIQKGGYHLPLPRDPCHFPTVRGDESLGLREEQMMRTEAFPAGSTFDFSKKENARFQAFTSCIHLMMVSGMIMCMFGTTVTMIALIDISDPAGNHSKRKGNGG